MKTKNDVENGKCRITISSPLGTSTYTVGLSPLQEDRVQEIKAGISWGA
jgi:hypothetical protein